MKKALGLFLGIAAAVLLAAGISYAENPPIEVWAQVPDKSPDIGVVILKFTDGNPDNNPWTNSEVVTDNTMDFGVLTHKFDKGGDAGVWYSKTAFCVVIYATPYGQPYQITSTCTGLVGENYNESLPDGCFGLTPLYSEDDEWELPDGSRVPQGPMPPGAELGTPGPAKANDKLIYSSEIDENGKATPRIIQAYYSIPPYEAGGAAPFPGYEPIPLEQKPDVYSGTVKITISQK